MSEKLKGQTIKLFVIESLKKLKTAELSNWVGKAYIGERKHSQVLQQIEELKNATGIYFLLSDNDEETRLYIGEADDSANRIRQHLANKDKEWFENFIIFISKDSNLTKAHVRYLEKELYSLAKENLTTIMLENGTSPPGSNLPACDIADMDIFLENILFVLNNLGIINFAKVKTGQECSQEESKDVFYMPLTKDRTDASGNILKGQMVICEEGYKLLKGSYIEPDTRESFKKHIYYNLRQKLEKESLFEKDQNGLLKSKEDIYFKSASAAGATVRNRATNGRTDWKLLSGKSLEEYETGIT